KSGWWNSLRRCFADKSPLHDQVVNHFSFGHDAMGPARAIVKLLLMVDTQQAIHGRQYIGRRHRAIGRKCTSLVAGSKHHARTNATASEHDRIAIVPVIATAIVVVD